jgi:hypothetical protein
VWRVAQYPREGGSDRVQAEARILPPASHHDEIGGRRPGHDGLFSQTYIRVNFDGSAPGLHSSIRKPVKLGFGSLLPYLQHLRPERARADLSPQRSERLDSRSLGDPRVDHELRRDPRIEPGGEPYSDLSGIAGVGGAVECDEDSFEHNDLPDGSSGIIRRVSSGVAQTRCCPPSTRMISPVT